MLFALSLLRTLGPLSLFCLVGLHFNLSTLLLEKASLSPIPPLPAYPSTSSISFQHIHSSLECNWPFLLCYFLGNARIFHIIIFPVHSSRVLPDICQLNYLKFQYFSFFICELGIYIFLNLTSSISSLYWLSPSIPSVLFKD